MSTPQTDWQEVVAPDEAQRFAAYAAAMQEIQARRDAPGHGERALHPKGIAGVRAEFVVHPDVPAHARAGVFAAPGTYRAYVRFSNGAARHQPDAKADVRGMAVKLVGVPGRKLIPGLEAAATQDFLMIQAPFLVFRDADEFMFFVRESARPLTLLPRVVRRLGLGRTIWVLRTFAKYFGGRPASLAALRYWSPVPIRFGAYAAKYGVRPRAFAAHARPAGRGPDYLRDELADRLAAGPLVFDFGAQFYTDASRTPIEDASIEWTEAETPFVPLATLTLPQQDLRDARGERLAAYVESLSFDPWHAPEEFRPLGNVMRARKDAYYASTQRRTVAPEPDGTESP